MKFKKVHGNSGKNNPNYGKTGDKHPNWKGGKEASTIRHKEYLRQYYIKNKKAIDIHNTSYTKIHRILHTDKYLWTSIKSRCRIKNIKLGMTKEEFCFWYNKQIKTCHYCKMTEKEWKVSTDSLLKKFYQLQIDRKCPEKGYRVSNIVLACPRCNVIKSNRFTEKQMKKIGRILHATH